MSSYIPNSENGRDLYSRELESYSSESPILAGNVMMYMNFSSASTGEFTGGNSQQPNSCIDIPNIGVHDSNLVAHQEFLSNIRESWRDGRNQEMMLMEQMGSRNSQGLSLSLGAQIQRNAGIQFHSGDYRNPNLGFSSFFSADSDSVKTDGIGNSSKGITDSKYLKAAQELLDEIVNVGKALKQHNSKKESTDDDSKGIDGELKNLTSSNQQESDELSAAEKQDLQNKMTKLISMMDEVDRRYKQYYHQMQIVVTAFDVIAGCGAAKPYTALALQTISRHFRCLRDAINGQIKSTHRSLGETDSTNGKGVGISRLRFVDQQLRQRALQQLGMMQQHTWRPQRGLPETSVSILRAWLFEHFLHPYPKDSDKSMLARQTGLTRSQVSNWFINARVRLWKPMVEEMYKEEAGDAEMESNSSSDFAPKNSKGDKKASLDKGEDNINQSTAASAFESKSSDQAHDVEKVGTSNNSEFQNMMVLSSSRGEDEQLIAAAYQMPPRFEIGNAGGVSLTLGLQHCKDGSLPPMASLGSHHHSFIDIREGGGGGGGVYEAGGGSSVGPETVDFDCVDSGNRQQRFGSSNLVHDFVA